MSSPLGSGVNSPITAVEAPDARLMPLTRQLKAQLQLDLVDTSARWSYRNIETNKQLSTSAVVKP